MSRRGQTLVVDGLSLHVRVSARRARLGLTVERDASLTLRTPKDCSLHRAEKFVRDNRRWIESKLLLSKERRQLHPVRSLYDGEIHRYLGRDYKLLLVDGPVGEGTKVTTGGALGCAGATGGGPTAAEPVRGRRPTACAQGNRRLVQQSGSALGTGAVAAMGCAYGRD